MPVAAWWFGAWLAASPIEDAPLPLASGDCTPRAGPSTGILFVNFDGAVLQRDCGEDAHFNCSTLFDRFDGYVGPFIGTDAQRLTIIDGVKQDLAPYDVRVVTSRPPEDLDYTMILYGELGPQSFAGLAPYIDCGDRFLNDIAFAQGTTNPITGATVIVHEAGHTWGLEHVSSLFDNMFPVADSLSATFTDECQPLVADTELTLASGTCVLAHGEHCDLGFQRSHQELLARFGPAVPDLTPPIVDIVAPARDRPIQDGTVASLVIDLDDDRAPQIYGLEIHIDGASIFDGTSWGRFDSPLRLPGVGTYTLEVTASDDAGRSATATRIVEVVPATASREDQTRDVSDGCDIAGAPASQRHAWLALVALLGARRRRRPRGHS